MKTIRDLIFDTSDLPANGASRNITIVGDDGAVFNLEIQNEDSHYYNFYTNKFQAIKTGLTDIIIENGSYSDTVVFPAISDNDHYDVYLYATINTQHLPRTEFRFADGSLDINSSTGSNSDLLQKIIYQYVDVTLTLTAQSITGDSSFTGITVSADTFSVSRGSNYLKVPFDISVTTGSNKSFTLDTQPSGNDIYSNISRVVGSAISVSGENIYPTVTSTDTVDGTVENATKIVMDTNVASTMVVGDKVTGLSSGDGVTVAELDPDGDNPKEFSVSANVSIDDGATLSFSNEKHHVWSLNNIYGLTQNNTVIGDNIAAGTKISPYIDSTTVFSGTPQEEEIINVSINALDSLGSKPTVTNGVITSQSGNVVFNNQQPLVLAGDTIKFWGQGRQAIFNATGYDIEFTNLKVTLGQVSTRTTSAVSASTSVPVAERAGILDNVSTVRGIGIDANNNDPKVASGAGAVSGAGTIVLAKAQTLENGVTLFFDGASNIANITGEMQIYKVGTENTSLYFNLDNILTAT
tara:strand:+ start:6004 stop:7572 length:1569 start_codon:yes stop_codon:yes gene_type:complete